MAATSTPATEPVSAAAFEDGPARATGTPEQVISWLEALVRVVWLGGMIFFSFAVAPALFFVLPTRDLAGQVVNSLIGKLEVIGLICGPLLLALQLFAW